MAVRKINDVAKSLSLSEDELMTYGQYMAKIIPSKERERRGKLILTTAITPTKAGEGKTTTSIGLADALTLSGKKALLALREPSLGPVFGVKGGGTGGGEEVLYPEDKINLHFTGDMHALTSTNNLISAVIDNELFQSSELGLDPDKITFPRCMDMNDRSLRKIRTCLNPKDGPEHNSSFVITAASEVMAILCLSKDLEDFLDRCEDIEIGTGFDGKKHFVKELGIRNAIRCLMEDAIHPNLVQTKYSTPAIVHGGPFANIAHGTNSIIATKLALSLADYVVTEAGFGSDLGMEKYLDIVSPIQGFSPDLVVMVATVRALKSHGGVAFSDLGKEDIASMEKGLGNLIFHCNHAKRYGIPVLVSINRFPTDTDDEIQTLERLLDEHNIPHALNSSYINGPEGALSLASKALEILERNEKNYKAQVDESMDIFTKIETIAKNSYGADGVEYMDGVKEQILALSENEKKFSVCMSKTPNSLSDDAKLLNVPKHTIHIKGLRVFDGARFVVPLTGSIVTMPGMPKVPLAKKM